MARIPKRPTDARDIAPSNLFAGTRLGRLLSVGPCTAARAERHSPRPSLVPYPPPLHSDPRNGHLGVSTP